MDFSTRLETERSDLFEKQVQINPFAPNRRWFVKFPGLFSNVTYKSLTGELATLRILVRDCAIFFIISFILIIIVSISGTLG